MIDHSALVPGKNPAQLHPVNLASSLSALYHRGLILVMVWTTCFAPVLVSAAPQRIVGYLPRYRSVRPAQFEALTHVIVFSVVPDPDLGTFKVFSENPVTGEIVFEAPPGGAGLSTGVIDQVMAEAANYGVKVGLCIGGGDVSTPFRDLVINGKVDAFADHVRDFALAHGLDEINIDWEKPSNQWDPGRAEKIFAALSERLQEHNIDLTAAWTASTRATHALKAARLCRRYSDAVYVMSYDSTLSSFQQRFEFYTKPVSEGGQGYPPEKVCPGVQFFGRDAARSLTKTYSQLVNLAAGDIDPAINTMLVNGKTLKFTGQNRLGAISDYSKQVGGGLMIWEIGQDAVPEHDDSLTGVLLERLGMTANTGTPHWWLRKHGISENYETAVLGDPDLDGQPTWREYVSDTDPFNFLSRLEILPVSDGFQFQTRADRYYTVFESPDLSAGSWSPLDGYPLAGTGDPVALPYPPEVDRRFYRLSVSLSEDPIVP